MGREDMVRFFEPVHVAEEKSLIHRRGLLLPGEMIEHGAG
jgi:hypothetical protein